MGLKILHSADWHLGSPFGGFSQELRLRLKEEQKKLPEKIADLCRREDCDLMLLAGDLFDGPPDREMLDIVKKALAACEVPVFLSPGNHDHCGLGFWKEEPWPENVHIFTGGLESVALPELDCRVYGAGFQSMDCESLLEGFAAKKTETYQLAVLHGDPVQRNSPYNPVTLAQVRGSGLQYLALGHIHKAGAFRAGQTLCAWPGCPMGRGWDETGEKGLCIVTLDQDAQICPMELDTLAFHDLQVDAEGDPAAALERTLPAAGSEDFYRVTLTGEGPVELASLREICGRFPNLELRDRTEETVDLWGDRDEDSLEGIYFGMLRKAMEEDPENGSRYRLAAEISRKLLRGREVAL